MPHWPGAAGRTMFSGAVMVGDVEQKAV